MEIPRTMTATVLVAPHRFELLDQIERVLGIAAAFRAILTLK